MTEANLSLAQRRAHLALQAARRLRASRKQIGLSQSEVAKQLQVAQQTVSCWETGRALPDLVQIVELAGVYGVCTDHILLGKPMFYAMPASRFA